MAITDQERARMDALAKISGYLNAVDENRDSIDTDTLTDDFNRLLDEAGVESEVLPVE